MATSEINLAEWPDEIRPTLDQLRYLEAVEVVRAPGNPAATAIAGSLWVGKGDTRVRTLPLPEGLTNAAAAVANRAFLVRPAAPDDEE